jgi:glutamate N-acetyltransferase/amino-acid N-acetyltransferase
MPRIELARESGRRFTRAMMTTDTVEKVRAVRFEIDGVVYTVAGSAKGSGMVHPDMATVFCFLTTDANVSSVWLQDAVRRVGNASINMVDVDMDTSTSDTMLVFANGAAGGPCLSDNPTQAAQLEQALLAVSVELAKDLARDGEGATTLIEAVVSGAHSEQDARAAARTVVSSPLIKSMITGRDPNLGRVLMALGRSGAELAVERLSVWIGEHQAFARGVPTDLPHAVISQAMASETVVLRADLGLGEHTATAWGCNLTDEYVHINGDYTT